jgi:transcriptional regulator with XRE-family HTH domain
MEGMDEDEQPGGGNEEFLRRLGERIREERRARKLSQEQLAFDANLTQHYLSQVELGQRNASVSTVRAIAIALQIPLVELLAGTEPGDESVPPTP